MNTRSELIEGVTVVSFTVEALLDWESVNQLERDLMTLLVEEKPKALVVDFSGVRHVTSGVLGVLATVWKHLADMGRRGCVCGLQPELKEVFGVTQLQRLIPIKPDLNAAVDALR